MSFNIFHSKKISEKENYKNLRKNKNNFLKLTFHV